MRFLIGWILDLFRKPEEEITVFPVPVEKKKPQVKKATTRPKKPAVIAKKVAVKKTVKKAKTK